MRIFIAILLAIFSGCATVSEYNQGCRDGVTVKNVLLYDDTKQSEKEISDFCDKLDSQHRAQMRREHPGMKGY